MTIQPMSNTNGCHLKFLPEKNSSKNDPKARHAFQKVKPCTPQFMTDIIRNLTHFWQVTNHGLFNNLCYNWSEIMRTAYFTFLKNKVNSVSHWKQRVAFLSSTQESENLLFISCSNCADFFQSSDLSLEI